MSMTHVFTAYLKNSVTSSVDPLRVIDWRMAACFVGGIVEDIRRLFLRATDASPRELRYYNARSTSMVG
jgi:hypothetical protein